MNDFSELETELKQLRPAAVAPELAQRVERALAHAASATPTAGILPKPKVRLNWFAIGLGVTAAAAVFLLARVEKEEPATPQPTFASLSPAPSVSESQAVAGLVPDGFTQVVYGTRDEGLLFPGDGTQPVRRLRARSRETLQWKDRSTGASLRVSYPTEEVELIPVAGQ